MGTSCCIGIVLGRRRLAGVRVEGARTVRCGEHPLVAERSVPQTLTALLAELISADPSTAPEVSLALSPSYLACAERVDAPARGVSLDAVAGSIAEGLAAGETLEELTVAHAVHGPQFELVAARTAQLRSWIGAVESAYPGVRWRLVTSLPSLVARWPMASASGAGVFWGGGDAVIANSADAGAAAWRAFPVADADEAAARQVATAAGSTAALSNLGQHETLTPLQSAAMALTQLDADELPNLAVPMGKAQGALKRRVSKSFAWAVAGAALLLFSAGILCEQRRRAYEDALLEVDRAEQRLWASAQPDAKARQGRLAAVVVSRVRVQERAAKANDLPSALAFWSELAGQMPHPNKLGLSVESVSLSRTEGRLVGQVQAAPDDPLKHAAALEAALNQAPHLTARGEFETRNEAVSVRLRLDYRPPHAEAPMASEDAP